MNEFKFELYPNSIGVRIFDIDLTSDLNSHKISEIYRHIGEHKVVIIEDQHISDSQLEEFAYKFGSPFKPEATSPVLGSQEVVGSIVVVGNNSTEFKHSYLGHQEVLPHSDHQWIRMPSSMSMLYAVDIDKESAPTQWTNMVKAYDELDAAVKKRIEHLKMITYNPFFRPFGSVSAKYVNAEFDIPPGDKYPHPLVRVHPMTGEKILYFNMAYEVEFLGINYNEGLELFELLKNHVHFCASKYTHNWKNNDLVIWDNRATIHYRPAFDSSIRRVLKRITVAGEIPF